MASTYSHSDMYLKTSARSTDFHEVLLLRIYTSRLSKSVPPTSQARSNVLQPYYYSTSHWDYSKLKLGVQIFADSNKKQFSVHFCCEIIYLPFGLSETWLPHPTRNLHTWWWPSGFSPLCITHGSQTLTRHQNLNEPATVQWSIIQLAFPKEKL